jgi:hypothetical protein
LAVESFYDAFQGVTERVLKRGVTGVRQSYQYDAAGYVSDVTLLSSSSVADQGHGSGLATQTDLFSIRRKIGAQETFDTKSCTHNFIIRLLIFIFL